MNKLLLLTTFLVLAIAGNSQEMGNINADISDNEKYFEQINEVYGQDYPDDDLRLSLVSLLRDRIQLVPSELTEGKDFPLLSGLPLNNKIADIPAFVPGEFNPQSFNPLYYGFNFFDTKDQCFRIDGTNFLLVVKPYSAKL